MKRVTILSAAVLALAVSAFAQQAAPQPAPTPAAVEVPDFRTGTVTFGLQQYDVDTVSSKFFEYRDLPNGGTAPWFSFQGK
jgi:hypothetical protein